MTPTPETVTARDALHEVLTVIGVDPRKTSRAAYAILAELADAGYAVVRLPKPTGVSAHRETWESRDWQIDSHVGGDIELTTRSGPPDGDRLSLIYDLGAACIAAAIHNEENR